MLTSNRIIIIILLSLSTAPAIFLGAGNINLLLITILFCAPVLFLKYLKIDKRDILLIALIVTMFLIPMSFNQESFRVSTVIYSILFCILFITYKQVLYVSDLPIDLYLKILKYIIYAYFFTLVIQQFCVLTGLPIFNISNYDPTEPWKLNSLSSEPSHTARIVALLMYSYIVITEIIKEKSYSFIEEFKNDKFIWFTFLWLMMTSNSGTAFAFLAIIFLKFLQLKNIIFIGIVSLISIFLLEYLDITAFQRTFNFALSVLTFDINTMMKVDHSASLRIAPMIVLFDQIDISSFQTWIGHGIDSTGLILDKYIHGIPKGFTGGGSLYLIYEYGLISWILFMIFSFITVVKIKEPISLMFWVFLIFMYSLNSQIVWLCMLLMFTNKWFYQNNKSIQRNGNNNA